MDTLKDLIFTLQALGMLFWHEYNVKKALDDMPNFKAFQGKLQGIYSVCKCTVQYTVHILKLLQMHVYLQHTLCTYLFMSVPLYMCVCDV